MSKYIMAIDGGTGSVRAVIFDDSGNQIASHQEEWHHLEELNYPGSMNFDYNKNWNLIKKCIKSALIKSKLDNNQIEAISTTSMREGIVLYDKNNNEIWACANVDSRSDKEVQDLKKLYPGLESEIYSISGETFALSDISRLLWVKNNLPDIYKKIDKLTMINDWISFKLTGHISVEPTNASTSGLLNLSRRDWDIDILKNCGIKNNILPKVIENGQIISNISTQAAYETGLSENTIVVMGGGDCQLASIGVGSIHDNDSALFGGSFWQYEYNTSKLEFDEKARIRINCHALSDLWQYEALAFNPGLVLRWFRDAFCQEEILKSKETGVDPYELLNNKAKDVPAGSYGIISCFSDIMNFMNWRHASPTFTNFNINPVLYNKYSFYRSLLENAAYLVRGHIDLVKEFTHKEPDVIIFAGGASKSSLWCQIVADVTKKPVKVPVVKEATALGAAILAGCGVGIFEDLYDGVDRCVNFEKTYYPNENNFKSYDIMYKKWKVIYKEQLKLSDQAITQYMWKAPGL